MVRLTGNKPENKTKSDRLSLLQSSQFSIIQTEAIWEISGEARYFFTALPAGWVAGWVYSVLCTDYCLNNSLEVALAKNNLGSDTSSSSSALTRRTVAERRREIVVDNMLTS